MNAVGVAQDFSTDEERRIIQSDVHRYAVGELKYHCPGGKCNFRDLIIQAMVRQGCGEEKANHILKDVEEKQDEAIAGVVARAILSDPLVAIP